MTKIAIIGTGLIGRAWATIFCSHGFEVSLFDANPAAAKAAKGFIGKSLKELAGHGLVEDVAGSLKRVHLAKDLGHALKGAALAQENGPETLEAKKALFAEMDRLAPKKTILASSTSFIVASAFSEGLPGQTRCMVAHPVNPPHLVPIVELAPAPWTDPKAVARARKIYEKAGQVPVAFRIIGAGICSPQDLDKTIKDGLGLRWSFMGPFETIELNAPGGIPDYCARYGPSLERMSSEHLIPDPYSPATVQKIMAEWPGEQSPERIAKLSKWRDARLAALKAHKLKALKKPAN